MFHDLSDFLSGFKMTVVSGLFLLWSLFLLLSKRTVALDPAWVTLVISGYPLLYSATTRLVKQRWLSSAFLISMAMVAALAIGEIFAAGEVAFIMAMGGLLEEKTIDQAKRGLKGLIGLVPDTGCRLDNEGQIEKTVPLSEIALGDRLRVRPGERVPVDGVIVDGYTAIDQSVMTGESLPVQRSVGDEVFGGSINRYGTVDIQATKVGQDTTIQRLISLVQEAENKKSHTQRLADRWAVWLVPIALIVAVGTFGINAVLGYPTLEALTRGVTVLVVFCPCALALATPTSVIAAIGQAAKFGVIVKSGEALEKMGKVDTLAFDKTGPLNQGRLQVSDILPFEEGLTSEELLTYAASAEVKSEHPLGKTVVEAAKTAGLPLLETEAFAMKAGGGVSAVLLEREIFCGSKSYLEEKGIAIPIVLENELEDLREEGKIVILVGSAHGVMGAIALSDCLRKETHRVIADLHQLGSQTLLLTGDHQKTAEYIGKKAGFTVMHGELLPEEKVHRIEELQRRGHVVGMVGDGINDAPALKVADVGVAMAKKGSDISVEAADIALIGDDIGKLIYLKKLSEATLHTIHLNLTLSMVINFIAVALSAIGVLNPVTGALVHNAGSVLVVFNAALLYDRNFHEQPRPKKRKQFQENTLW